MAVTKQSRKKPPEPAGHGPKRRQGEEEFPNPFNDRQILAYYRQLHFWHGFIRFLGLPHLKDNPDVPIDRLFVPPELSRQPLPPDIPAKGGTERTDLRTTLARHPRLVVLGDPGSGKSTLVSWVAWALSRSSKGAWVETLGLRVPMPMVVRELELESEPGWDGLLDAFLARPVAEDLDREAAEELLRRGQAFVLLDGVDEIARIDRRRDLRGAVIEGVERYPGCRWLVTSRQVGYDRVPFHLLPEDLETETTESAVEEQQEGLETLDPKRRWAARAYIASFSDRQIERFAHNWYLRYEAASEAGGRKARMLVQAIHANPRTLRLARIPNLLTLMALIHRMQARLPHGRALLYSKIVEAYLESIDAFRGIQEVDYSLQEKKRWLAWVGFRMQRRRSTESAWNESTAREILVDEEELLEWLEEAMARSPRIRDVTEPGQAARAFVDYIARRSGLLLPRGQGRYAFTHLSFQEFFAALHFNERITSPRWFQRERVETRDGPKDLVKYAGQDSWREPLVILFGLLAGRPEWSEELASLLFGTRLSRVLRDTKSRRGALAGLLAEVSSDAHSGLPGDLRVQAWDACWRWELRRQAKAGPGPGQLFSRKPLVVQPLLSVVAAEQAAVWQSFQEVANQSELHRLSLWGATGLNDLSPLAGLDSLEWLDLRGTGVQDLTPLAGLQHLERLDLSGTSVEDLSPLADLLSLTWLDLSRTYVQDLAPLSGLHKLERLDLSGTRVRDLGPLADLPKLVRLDLSVTSVEDLRPLSGLKNLRSLYLSDTPVEDVSDLRGLNDLRILTLSGAPVEDVSPLKEIEKLEIFGGPESSRGPRRNLGRHRAAVALP